MSLETTQSNESLSTLSLSVGRITTTKIFSAITALAITEALGPNMPPGLVEVPSPAAGHLGSRLAPLLDLVFLTSCGSMACFPLESSNLPFLVGEDSGTFSRGHFSLITIPLVDEVATLDPSWPFFSSILWASFDKLIFFDIAAKQRPTSVQERHETQHKEKWRYYYPI